MRTLKIFIGLFIAASLFVIGGGIVSGCDPCERVGAVPLRTNHHSAWIQMSFMYVNNKMIPYTIYHHAYSTDVYEGKRRKTGEPCECVVRR